MDVVYFDGAAGGPEQDAYLEGRLCSLLPALQWEVTNQATVHHWFANNLEQVVPPLGSLEEGVATWPEFATCVGVNLDDEDSIGIVAPHGLYDLFHLRVRHNPLRQLLGMGGVLVLRLKHTDAKRPGQAFDLARDLVCLRKGQDS